jgi:hypothetical protein
MPRRQVIRFDIPAEVKPINSFTLQGAIFLVHVLIEGLLRHMLIIGLSIAFTLRVFSK